MCKNFADISAFIAGLEHNVDIHSPPHILPNLEKYNSIYFPYLVALGLYEVLAWLKASKTTFTWKEVAMNGKQYATITNYYMRCFERFATICTI